MKLKTILEQMDYEGVENAIEQFKNGSMERNRFLEYIQNQVEQSKQEYQQNKEQVSQARQRVQKMQQKMSRNRENGIGNAQQVGS